MKASDLNDEEREQAAMMGKLVDMATTARRERLSDHSQARRSRFLESVPRLHVFANASGSQVPS